MNRALKRIFESISRKFSYIVMKCKVTRVDNDYPQIEYFPNEVQDNVPLYQQYGFKSSPPKGSTCIAVSNGNRDSAVILGTKYKEDIRLKEGESCLFSGKSKIVLRERGVEIKTKDADLGKLIASLIEEIQSLSVIKEVPPVPPGTPPIERMMISSTSKANLNRILEKWSANFVDITP